MKEVNKNVFIEQENAIFVKNRKNKIITFIKVARSALCLFDMLDVNESKQWDTLV